MTACFWSAISANIEVRKRAAPFEQLQDAGMRTARLDDIVRQKDLALKSAVELLATGQVSGALEVLQQQDRVKKIPNQEERVRAIAKSYARWCRLDHSKDSILAVGGLPSSPITVTTIVQLPPAHITFQHNNRDTLKTTCPVPECEKEFEVLSAPHLFVFWDCNYHRTTDSKSVAQTVGNRFNRAFRFPRGASGERNCELRVFYT